MKVMILGGGLSALSLAFFLQNRKDIDEITLLEKEKSIGGLCRTFEFNGLKYDIGPHIIFSKDKEILDFMNELLANNNEKHRRSNRILHGKKFIQYPFENDLSKLPEKDLSYCVNTFINNPYKKYDAQNMLQFFLKTFGEGITNLYLRPYNEKIWKFDPSFMDTQMVERIPQPAKEDILKSAAGDTVDGYTHQLYFSYPKEGGIEALLTALREKLTDKVKILTNKPIDAVYKTAYGFEVFANGEKFVSDRLISTIPLNTFTFAYRIEKPDEVVQAAKNLRYNSIAIAIINVKTDRSGDNYAFTLADSKIVFHRLSKLDFMGRNYHKNDSVTYMTEVTFRKNDHIDLMSDRELIEKTIDGLKMIGFIDSKNDVNFTVLNRYEHAYVVYDLAHKQNTSLLRDYFEAQGINLNGRFGSFEYPNMDAVIRQSKNLSEKF